MAGARAASAGASEAISERGAPTLLFGNPATGMAGWLLQHLRRLVRLSQVQPDEDLRLNHQRLPRAPWTLDFPSVQPSLLEGRLGPWLGLSESPTDPLRG